MAQINAKAGPFQKPGLILLVALLLVVVVFFIPHPVAASADEIQALRLSYEGKPIENFDEDAVKEFLGQLSCHRSIAEHVPVQASPCGAGGGPVLLFRNRDVQGIQHFQRFGGH